jgi:dGTPase
LLHGSAPAQTETLPPTSNTHGRASSFEEHGHAAKIMHWENLINPTRITSSLASTPTSADHRVDFQRDWDRIIFSTPFRRLHDKTQVFPLPDDDVVHSRLTHSLEVASVGRSLGARSAQHLGFDDMAQRNIGDIIAAACLAHDIGNPPFGHAGEDAIARYFVDNSVPGLTQRELCDLTTYEGNAQGFRILCRLQFEQYGGMRLTAATLGAFLKYPRESGEDFAGGVSEFKKNGVFQSEVAILLELARHLQLPSSVTAQGGRGFRRHPFAYLLEAADDICNSILDLEDAARLGWITHRELGELLVALVPPRVADIALSYSDESERTGYLRATSIGALVTQCAEVFSANAQRLLDGESLGSLVKLCPSAGVVRALETLAREKCYRNPAVLEREAAGYNAIHGLLDRFIPPLVEAPKRGSFESRMAALLYQRAAIVETMTTYEKVMRALDYISGMTDSYAIASFRRLSGVTT